MGRPSDFSEDLAARICGELAEGRSLRSICREEWAPDKSTVFRWLAQHPGFRDQYARAKEESADALAEEILDIADDGSNDWMERQGEEGTPLGWQLNGEHIQRSRLRVDTRKWVASKLKPKKYGDRIEHAGDAFARDASQLSREDLIRIAAGSREGTAEAGSGDGEPSQVH